ncbi:MAG: hypothetical protein IAF02_26855 [Anaerolineae bacterium]|nr:hypothetical protein [Anaerolineae bacterium]
MDHEFFKTAVTRYNQLPMTNNTETEANPKNSKDKILMIGATRVSGSVSAKQ